MALDHLLEQDFIRVTEQAAIAAAKTMGFGDRRHSDQVAVEAMRHEMDSLMMDGRVVIGEGERDKAPMLYVGEEVGALRGRLLYAPDVYMDKIVVGPTARGSVHIDAPVAENLRNIANAFGRKVSDLTIVVLDRPRHDQLVADIRGAGARIR